MACSLLLLLLSDLNVKKTRNGMKMIAPPAFSNTESDIVNDNTCDCCSSMSFWGVRVKG